MAEVRNYVALPFVASDDGAPAGEPTECFNPVAVVMRAEALSREEGHVGAIAFSRTGDPATGDFSDARVIKKFGEVRCERATKDKTRGDGKYRLGPPNSGTILDMHRFGAQNGWPR
jgi:hypothetical protein